MSALGKTRGPGLAPGAVPKATFQDHEPSQLSMSTEREFFNCVEEHALRVWIRFERVKVHGLRRVDD